MPYEESLESNEGRPLTEMQQETSGYHAREAAATETYQRAVCVMAKQVYQYL